MRANRLHWWRRVRVVGATLAVSVLLVAGVVAQQPGTENGEWRYQSGDAGGSRFSPADQIDASNFQDLEVAWVWRNDNFSPHANYTFKSTPSYIQQR